MSITVTFSFAYVNPTIQVIIISLYCCTTAGSTYGTIDAIAEPTFGLSLTQAFLIWIGNWV